MCIEKQRHLMVAQSLMLRRIVGCGRAEEEPWVEWVKRATHKARHAASSVGLKEWGPEHFRRKWIWAGRVARTSAVEWLYKVTTWRDSSWQAVVNEWGSLRPRRPSSRRWMRFEDSIRRFCRERGLEEWQSLAGNEETWQSLTSEFACWAAQAHFDL